MLTKKKEILVLYKIGPFYPQILKFKISENQYFLLIILKVEIYTIMNIYMAKAQQCHIKF